MSLVALFITVLAGCGGGGEGMGLSLPGTSSGGAASGGTVGGGGGTGGGGTAGATQGTPQASISLLGGALAPPCYGQIRLWDITKVNATSSPPAPADAPDTVTTGTDGKAHVEWTVTVTNKGLQGADLDGQTNPDQYLKVAGYISVRNNGSAPATIGNVALNLQEKIPGTTGYKTISTDAADATHGDLYTYNQDHNPDILGVNVAKGAVSDTNGKTTTNFNKNTNWVTLNLNSGSGAINFNNASDNTVWALTPQQQIPPSGTVNLFFDATFDLKGMKNVDGITKGGYYVPTAGSDLRAEFIVTFGNAGNRGSGGAAAENVDINGNGTTTDPDEAYVRSVPDRFGSFTVPSLVTCDETVTLTDSMSISDEHATLTPKTFGNQTPDENGNFAPVLVYGGPEPTPEGKVRIATGASATYNVTADVQIKEIVPALPPPAPLFDNADVTNTAYLKSDGLKMSVTFADGTVHDWVCCLPLDILDSATWHILSPNSTYVPVVDGYTTYTQGGWGNKPSGNNPGQILQSLFDTVYPSPNSYVLIGGHFTAKFTTAAAIEAYLPAGKTPSVLDGNLTNPTSTSAGIFAGQVLSVQLAVDFSDKGAVYTSADGNTTITFKPGFGDLIVTGTGSTALDGTSIRQLLAIANQVLGGDQSVLPVDYSIANLSDLMTRLTESFDNGKKNDWANDHLSAAP